MMVILESMELFVLAGLCEILQRVFGLALPASGRSIGDALVFEVTCRV